MIAYLNAERIKIKSTALKRILFVMPLAFFIFALYTTLFITQKGHFNGYLAQIYNIWPFLFLPVVLAASCSMNLGLEKKSGSLRHIKANGLSLSKLWKAKIINMALYQLMSSIIIMAVTIGGSMIVFGAVPDVLNVINTTLLITLASLPLIPFNLMIAHYANSIITVGINVFGALVSVVWLAPHAYFWLTPWGVIMRIPAALMGIHPNGTPLEAGDPMQDSSVLIYGVAVSVILFVLLTALGNRLFKRKLMT